MTVCTHCNGRPGFSSCPFCGRDPFDRESYSRAAAQEAYPTKEEWAEDYDPGVLLGGPAFYGTKGRSTAVFEFRMGDGTQDRHWMLKTLVDALLSGSTLWIEFQGYRYTGTHIERIERIPMREGHPEDDLIKVTAWPELVVKTAGRPGDGPFHIIDPSDVLPASV